MENDPPQPSTARAAVPSASAPPSALIGFLLRRAYVRAEQAAAQVVPAPFHIRELAILSMLETRGPMSQQELAGLGGVNRTIMVKLIDRLEERGLVRRERNPRDRRSYALAPTVEGRAAIALLRPSAAQGEALLVTNLRPSEHKRLVGLLRQLLEGTDALDAGPLAKLCGYLITKAHHLMRRRGIDALAPVGIEPRHVGALSVVAASEPCSQQQLAGALGVTAPVVVKTVDELERLGLIRRQRNPADRRANELTLSTEGRARLADALTAIDLVHRFVRDRLGDDGVAELRGLLQKLIAAPEGQASSDDAVQPAKRNPTPRTASIE